MAHLTFRDSQGVVWRVWATIPQRPEILTESHRDGWLTFDSETERRRLSPIPAGWEEVSPARLELMCRLAEPVRRLTPPMGQPVVEPDQEP